MSQYSPSHTADPLDAAAAIDGLSRDAAVARIRHLQRPGQPRSEQCQECGEAIAHERIQAVPGVKYCIDCANDLDRRAMQFARNLV
jgi:RNA polymerase-binding transcription factor DksA